MSDFPVGDYEVISPVSIRREPRIISYLDDAGHTITNKVGLHSIGTRVRIHDTLTDTVNQTWGRISESDAAGKAQWICMRSINRTFVKFLASSPAPSDSERLAKLEAWAKTKGYKGYTD